VPRNHPGRDLVILAAGVLLVCGLIAAIVLSTLNAGHRITATQAQVGVTKAQADGAAKAAARAKTAADAAKAQTASLSAGLAITQSRDNSKGIPNAVGTPAQIVGAAPLKVDAGLAGAAGVIGASGVTGLTGPIGPQGIPGLSPACLKDLLGCMGLNGATGQPGVNGQPGVSGKDGANGQPGTNGANGANGAPGPSPYPFVFHPTLAGGMTETCTVTSPTGNPPCTIDTPPPPPPTTSTTRSLFP